MMKSFGSLFVTLFVAVCILLPQSGFAKGKKVVAKGAGVNSKSKIMVKSSKTVKPSPATASRPSGWDRGKKTGWRGGKYPPGWSKWNVEQQDKWVIDRDLARTDLRRTMVTYGISVQTRDQINAAFDETILGGMVINDARKKLIAGLKDPAQRKLFLANTFLSVIDYLK